jgi:hypothetical protein
VLDHDHAVALLDQALQHRQEPRDVDEVQARRRLVEDHQGAPGAGASQLGRQLDPLGLAA